MGRAFGLFLLVVGFGLAAYGLPTSETKWGVGSGTMPGPSPFVHKPLDAPDGAHSEVADRGLGRPTGGAASATAGATGIAPMDKLRAAAQSARAIAAGQEPVGSLQTLSANPASANPVALDQPPAPRPVTLPSTARSTAPPAPSIVSAARRETAPSKGGWTTVATTGDGASPPAAGTSGHGLMNGAGNAGKPIEQASPIRTSALPAMTKAATIAVSGARATEGTVQSTSKLRPDAEEKSAAKVAAAPRERLETRFERAATERLEKPAAKPAPSERTQVVQRYTPPVFLGKRESSGSQSGPSNGEPSRRAAFKTQDFWENGRRTGM